MKQQIIISGLGGQGALTITRVLAEAAAALGLEVLTSETHGMAQRGGTVISMIKVGPFRGPLIPAGRADVGLFLHAKNLGVHRFYLRGDAGVFVNAGVPGNYQGVDAGSLARQLGAPVAANLILLGYAAGKGGLFCEADLLEQVIREKTPARFREINLKALRAGVDAAAA
ncbi:MAG: 2-oxoacid:acceptor oxidoreductase family protein [Syntrophales bacterium]|nr:2-oxoacid:acceptor oxidoreductase family protein [Syntrophales bacterium]MDD5641469.1 2-oxoacid:acceptor oxidoreductase family protein [Syntrophales bacterium]